MKLFTERQVHRTIRFRDTIPHVRGQESRQAGGTDPSILSSPNRQTRTIPERDAVTTSPIWNCRWSTAPHAVTAPRSAHDLIPGKDKRSIFRRLCSLYNHDPRSHSSTIQIISMDAPTPAVIFTSPRQFLPQCT
jgi:hypothetical protein